MLMKSDAPSIGRDVDPLERLYRSAVEMVQGGQTAQVVFDIDDTLFWVKPRKRAIFGVMAQEEQGNPPVCDALKALTVGPLPYDVVDALRRAGIQESILLNRLKTRFFDLFFDGMYTIHDEPVQGAAPYVQRLHAAGVRVVYLSGRPDAMLDWTRNTLSLAGFPVDEGRTSLVLKCAAHQHLGDAEFKERMALRIAEAGAVVGCFDNEPANLNAMLTGFQDAQFFWLRTDGLANPPDLLMTANHIQHFLDARARLRMIYEGSPDGLPDHVTIRA